MPGTGVTLSINHLLLGLGLGLKVLCIPRETPLEKTNFSFMSGCQLEIASRIGTEAHVHLPSQHWDSSRPRPVQALCMLPKSPWDSTCISQAVFGGDIPFRSECSKVFHSLCLFQLWVFAFITNWCKRKLPWWWLEPSSQAGMIDAACNPRVRKSVNWTLAWTPLWVPGQL